MHRNDVLSLLCRHRLTCVPNKKCDTSCRKYDVLPCILPVTCSSNDGDVLQEVRLGQIFNSGHPLRRNTLNALQNRRLWLSSDLRRM